MDEKVKEQLIEELSPKDKFFLSDILEANEMADEFMDTESKRNKKADFDAVYGFLL